MDDKQTLHRYLRRERESLLGKLDGLGERDVRRPMTGTGTNLLGLVKHTASVEIGYLGDVFDRPSGVPMPWFAEDAEVNADMWATAQESREEILALHRVSAAHADATIEALDLDAPGVVGWWPPERRQVTLHQILVHMIAETARHAGHADIVRELIDGAAGDGRDNLPDLSTEEWAAHRRRLEDAAMRPAATQGERGLRRST
jgi:uncharacterized damage-inducible protein DinB